MQEFPRPSVQRLFDDVRAAGYTAACSRVQPLCERDPMLRARNICMDSRRRAYLLDPDIAGRLPWHVLRMDALAWLEHLASICDGAAGHVVNPASVNGLTPTRCAASRCWRFA